MFYFGAVVVAGAYGFADSHFRLLIEKGVRWFAIGCVCLLPLLLLHKSLRSMKRAASRLRVKRAHQTLFKNSYAIGYNMELIEHLRTLLLRRLTRHISDFVEDADRPDIQYYRSYAQEIKRRIIG